MKGNETLSSVSRPSVWSLLGEVRWVGEWIAGARRESIEVGTSHIGMSVHPEVIRIVADRLAVPPGRWRPYGGSFRRAGSA